METSLLIAKLIATVFIATGLGMLLNPGFYEKTIKELLKSSTFILLGGMISMIIGTLIVLYHNIWEASWIVVITIFGWIGIAKGLMLLTFPTTLKGFEKLYTKSFFRFWGLLATAIGLFFGYIGFLA